MLTTLVEDYGVTVVFCTATQPAFHLRRGFGVRVHTRQARVREIVPEGREPFRAGSCSEPSRDGRQPGPRRPGSVWRSGSLECRQPLAGQSAGSRKRALSPSIGPCSGGNVLPVDRFVPGPSARPPGRDSARLAKGLECRVVSTQLIEAGVDVDFPMSSAPLGPLDSIAQAAGRQSQKGVWSKRAGSRAGDRHRLPARRPPRCQRRLPAGDRQDPGLDQRGDCPHRRRTGPA